MGFREDASGPENEANAHVIADYIKRIRIARDGNHQRELPACAECGKRHSGHYDCQK